MPEVKSDKERIKELTDALLDMLNQFGDNYCLSANEHACDVLNHPRNDSWVWNEAKRDYDVVKGDACFCRYVIYKQCEADRRRKLWNENGWKQNWEERLDD